jgi:Holliday junction resolvasome RuvABC endonuclease subunit
MIVLSVDIGSRNFGYSILEVEEYESKKYTFKLIKPEYIKLTADSIGDRLLVLKTRLEKEIEDELVDLIVYEDSKFQGRSAPDLHYVCGLLWLLGAQYQIPVKRISPTRVKKNLCGVGTAGKTEVEFAVLNLLSNPPTGFINDHCSDSCAVGIAHFMK